MKNFKLLLIVALLIPMLSSCNYNSLVEKKQGVEQQWAEVQNQYQRRADLIPNLVATVKGYATHESETLEKVTQARAAATSFNINADDLNDFITNDLCWNPEDQEVADFMAVVAASR